jgi:uncharacterized repeat protein (TIGR01451 family)
VTNSTFSGNKAGNDGSGIRNDGGKAELGNTILTDNPGDNCSGDFTDNGGNLVWGDSTCPGTEADPLLSALGDYGGPTQTFALLPGSAAINAGSDTICAAKDQRGVTRPQGAHCDIGAFESGGFTLSITGGNNQSTPVDTAFATALQVSVSPVSGGEPVNGGIVSFTPPASGASAAITASPAAISGEHASVNATANDILGSYNVNADTSGASSAVDFALENTCAGTITVTNSNDDGSGSLRQAITNICSGGTITFAGNYTIHLASQLTIGKNMTIDGAGHSVTVSGDTDNDGTGNVRVFYVNFGSTVNLNSLIISKGVADYGGGIISNGTLDINNSIVLDNSASEDGGGVLNATSAVLTITNSTFSENNAFNGGGFENNGTTTISNSTFSGNSTSWGGGGIDNYHGTLTITNSTFSGNNALWGGGVFNNRGTITISNSTFSGNSTVWGGGGIRNYDGTLTLRNTIVANNTGGNCLNAITNGGGNLVWGDTTCPGINADPRLSALGDYGSPTQTFALLPGSAAINAGSDTICAATDQRGVTRPQGSHCDIGAYESETYSLEIAKSVNDVSAEPGQTVTFTVVVTNTGPGITGGLISDTLPAGLNFLGSITLEPTGAGTIGFAPPVLAHSLVISANHTITVTFPVTVSFGLTGGSELNNTAWFTSTAVVTPVLASVNMTVVNLPPTAMDDGGPSTGSGFTTDEDTAFTTGNVLANDSDLNGDALFVTAINATGTKGLVTDNGDGTFYYDLNGQFDHLRQGEQATDTFAYTISDGHGGSDTATVNITITGVNDPPTAQDDGGPSTGSGFTTDEDTPFTTASVLANDSDPDGSTLSVTGINTSGTKGLVTHSGDGTFDYDPNGKFEDLAAGEQASDTFTYTLSDGQGGTDTAAVTITITGVDDGFKLYLPLIIKGP